LCVIKKPCKRGGYSSARGLQNTNPQWVVAPVEKKNKGNSRAQQPDDGLSVKLKHVP